ncbi:MAG: phosphatidylserine decarboxylase [Helicobacter sp.]|nr:phosphatidylserine decarboxylase [Helicobacter sp.]
MHYTNFISQVFEKIAHCNFPAPIQIFINRAYARFFKLDMQEFDSLESYPTLNALFTRVLREQRSFDDNQEKMISPCDSMIMEMGICKDNFAMQIKGKPYVLSDFITQNLEEGYWYVNFYLSPRDYHRFHAPIDLKIKSIAFVDGILLPVNKKSLEKNESLFNKNKRVVLKCEDSFGSMFYFIAVGALNVGKITIHIAPEISILKENKEIVYENPHFLKKGDEIGCFEMGSTIVVLSKNWQYQINNYQQLRFGDSIATHKKEADVRRD